MEQACEGPCGWCGVLCISFDGFCSEECKAADRSPAGRMQATVDGIVENNAIEQCANVADELWGLLDDAPVTSWPSVLDALRLVAKDIRALKAQATDEGSG